MRFYCTIKIEINKKEVGIAIKSKETHIARYLAKKLLATHYTGTIGYYLCLFMQKDFQLGSNIYGYTNETNSLTNLQDLITTLTDLCLYLRKQGFNLVDLLENVFNLCMHGCNYPVGIMFA